MARNENPPFQRGETIYNGTTVDTNNLLGIDLEGREWVVEDYDYTVQGCKPLRSGNPVKIKCVRNVSGAALLPKRLVRFQAGFFGQRVDGYAYQGTELAYPVDEFLPAAGVVNNDLFYIIVDGPAMCLTELDAGADNVINDQDIIVPGTGATSGATTAGRVISLNTQTLTGSSQTTNYEFVVQSALNAVGRAMSAVTTGNTNAGVLVLVGRF